MEAGTGMPGYNSLMPKSNGSVAEILKQNGYNTIWYGKNHNVPDWHSSQAGPFDLWPTGLGFEQFFGFIGGDTSQFTPAIFDGTRPVEPKGGEDYHLDADMADRAVTYIREQNALAPDKPFFIYYAPGTSHAPHHAPKTWIEKFKGKFDQGWDKVREETFARQMKMGIIPAGTKLTSRPKELRAWDSLDADHKRLYSRMMEVYAAALAHADYQINRILDAIEETGEMDNTLIIYMMGDNGADAAGGPDGVLNEMTFFNNISVPFKETLARIDELGGPNTFGNYPAAWAHAMDTPFQWTKQVGSHFGGTRNGLAISWPKRIKARGEIRSQFHHVIDIAPTILEAARLPVPTSINGVPQKPMAGKSMIYSFNAPKAPSTRRTQYFEMLGHRAIYSNGWVACTSPPDSTLPWIAVPKKIDVISGYKWELYNIDEDFSQSNDLAKAHPEKLKELQLLFYAEARVYDVLPLDNSKIQRLDPRIRPSLTRGRNTFTYYPGMKRIPEGTAPDCKNRSHTITAEIEISKGKTDGMLVTQGGRFGGWGLYVLKGKPIYVYNVCNLERYTIAGPVLSPGKHTIRYEFAYDGGGAGKGGTGTMFVDGKQVATGKIKRTMGYRISLDETFDCGEDAGEPVTDDYHVPFRFKGTLRKVVVSFEE
jgi:arylsulfatase